jgi:predicted MFS family arabinose efflux permease
MVLIYALSSAAGAAHVLWWPDYAVRGLGHSTSFASALWLTYGAASVLGPSLCGRLADRRGAAVAFAWTIGLQCAGGALPLVWSDPAALFASSALAGGGMVGCTAVALARAKEIAGEGAGALWRLSSAAWGAAQTAMGFGLAWLYGATGSHRDLFAASALCAGCAAVLSALAVRLQRRPSL